jgi:16S rRNA (cytosine1402-N4)-methyltransferase
MQIDAQDRGFSLKSSARADMRMGDGCDGDAVALIDRLDERELADVIYRYGEERRSYRVAGALKRARAAGVESGEGLAEAIAKSAGGWQPRHPALRTFQALRIAVNGELAELESLLAALSGLTAPGGIAVVISFHSLEDRLVKHAFRDQAKAGRWTEIARHPITPGDDEVAANPRAHSAKLRWARSPETHHDR